MKPSLRLFLLIDIPTYGEALKTVLDRVPDVETVGRSSRPDALLQMLSVKTVDIVILDLEHPEFDGLAVFHHIRRHYPEVGVVILSGSSRKSSNVALKALEEGALEVIPTSHLVQFQSDLLILGDTFHSIFRAFSLGNPPKRRGVEPISNNAHQKQAEGLYDLVVIGISTGGPNALTRLIPALPSHLGVPVLLVQHMPSPFTASLANDLDRKSRLRVVEAQEGEPVLPNTVYVAKGGRHMVIRKAPQPSPDNFFRIHLTDSPPENNCRPSIDVLCHSVSQVYSGRVLVVMMTGMGHDGRVGVKALKASLPGCYCLTQDEASSVVYGMPRAVVEAGLSDESLSLDNIAQRICQLVLPPGQGVAS